MKTAQEVLIMTAAYFRKAQAELATCSDHLPTVTPVWLACTLYGTAQRVSELHKAKQPLTEKEKLMACAQEIESGQQWIDQFCKLPDTPASVRETLYRVREWLGLALLVIDAERTTCTNTDKAKAAA